MTVAWRYTGMILLLLSVNIMAEEVVIVKASSSAPDVREKNYAASVARNMSRWLTGVNIDHDIITDDQTASGGLKGVKVAVLSYNPAPGKKQLSALSSSHD